MRRSSASNRRKRGGDDATAGNTPASAPTDTASPRASDAAQDAAAAVAVWRERFLSFALPAIVLVLVGAYFWALQFRTDAIIATDGYFQIKFSYLMAHGHGVIKKMPWLYYTIHRDYYRDHHFLQHILYIPFTFGDLRLGAKFGAWFFATLAMATFYFVAARRGRLPAAILTLALMGSTKHFLFRMMLPRVPSMALAMLLLVFAAGATRRYRWLGFLMFAYVWLYDGFILGVFALVCLMAGELLVERRLDWRLPAWTLAAVVAGTVVNPYFPGNLESYRFNFTRAATDAQTELPNTGFEWRPLDSDYLLEGFSPTWIVFAVGLLAVALARRPRRETIGLLLFTFLLTGLMMKARRYAEVWPPMVFLLLALAWADFWDEEETRDVRWGRRARWIGVGALALTLGFIPSTHRRIATMIDDQRPFETFKGAGEYLLENSEPGEIVFNTDWAHFSPLFFFNSKNYYVLGLDQLYMARHDWFLYEAWRDISTGKIWEPSKIIRNQFNADYVVVRHVQPDMEDFMRYAVRDPGLKAVFRDRYCTVFEVKGKSGFKSDKAETKSEETGKDAPDRPSPPGEDR